jgi:hypothetical protein
VALTARLEAAPFQNKIKTRVFSANCLAPGFARHGTAAKQFAEKHDPSTSAAKAFTEEKGFIAALKRCATQNHCFSANCKACGIFCHWQHA